MTRTIAVLGAVVVASVVFRLFVARDGRQAIAGPDRPRVADFALLDQHGRFHQLYRYASARAVVLYSYTTGCPSGGPGLTALAVLRKQYPPREVVVLALDPDRQDGRAALQQATARLDADLPVLRDESQLVTESLGISRTNEALLLDPRTWQVIYRGAIEPNEASGARRPLGEALAAVLADLPVAIDPPPANGCALAPAAAPETKAAIGYASEIVPLLRAKCVPCHTGGGIAPWPMDSYERVKNWGPRIREVILTGRMAPWHADPAIGRFSPDRSLTPVEKRRLIHWLDAGAPRGTGADPLVSNPPPASPPWPLGPPDLVIDVPAQTIPASGVIDYRYVRVPVPLTTDRWVRAVQVKPSNRAVTHHILVFVEYPPRLKIREPRWADGASSFFAVYAPGYEPRPFPSRSGSLLPAGAMLVFQLHYMAMGHEMADRPQLALYFHREPPALNYRVVSAVNAEFRIPPYAQDHEVEATYIFDRDATLHGFLPHMHLRGSRFRYDAKYPDGRREALLSVPHYDFAWQALYTLERPKRIPAGTRIVAHGAYDNSADNPANPDPSREVRWGGQSWDEMFVGYLTITEPLDRRR